MATSVFTRVTGVEGSQCVNSPAEELAVKQQHHEQDAEARWLCGSVIVATTVFTIGTGVEGSQCELTS